MNSHRVPRADLIEILSVERAFAALKNIMSVDVEEFWALALDPQKRLLCSKMLFRGTVDACMVHPRDVFRFACMNNASSLIVAHNHPSEDLEPSHHDIQITKQLIAVGKLIEIPILDHLILTSKGFCSLAQGEWCEF